MATNLCREQLLKRCWASTCRQCCTDTSACFSLTYIPIFFCGFFFSKSSYIILTAPTIWNILAPFSMKTKWIPTRRCRAIFGQMYVCAKCTLVFKECFFSAGQDSHFWTRVSWFIARLVPVAASGSASTLELMVGSMSTETFSKEIQLFKPA